nr:replication factor C subunit 2 [Tanacetum cinerariifolium]
MMIKAFPQTFPSLADFITIFCIEHCRIKLGGVMFGTGLQANQVVIDSLANVHSLHFFLQELYGDVKYLPKDQEFGSQSTEVRSSAGSNLTDKVIDVVRNKIKMFANKEITLPHGKNKIIILDEADRAQQALKRTMEIYSNSIGFALACNTSEKIIEPILSRCALPGAICPRSA